MSTGKGHVAWGKINSTGKGDVAAVRKPCFINKQLIIFSNLFISFNYFKDIHKEKRPLGIVNIMLYIRTICWWSISSNFNFLYFDRRIRYHTPIGFGLVIDDSRTIMCSRRHQAASWILDRGCRATGSTAETNIQLGVHGKYGQKVLCILWIDEECKVWPPMRMTEDAWCSGRRPRMQIVPTVPREYAGDNGHRRPLTSAMSSTSIEWAMWNEWWLIINWIICD